MTRIGNQENFILKIYTSLVQRWLEGGKMAIFGFLTTRTTKCSKIVSNRLSY